MNTAFDQAATRATFESADQLADWLDSLHETNDDGAITGRKWLPAQRAAAAVRAAAQDDTATTTAEELALERSAHEDTVRAAARLANALQDLFNVAGADPVVRRAFTAAEHDVAAYKNLERYSSPANQPALL